MSNDEKGTPGVKLLDGKVAIVTGGGQGIGRAEALSLAEAGATVVVNDLSSAGDDGVRPADAVVAEIRARGGSAIANYDDCADWDGGTALIQSAMDIDGHLDVLVCNAGIVRDRILHKLSLEEWDAVLRVNLTGHFVPTRLAAALWRDETKRTGKPVNARIIYTSSEAGMTGHIGQCNYAAAKAGVLGLCFTAAQELERVGVTVNTISPRARTPMTTAAFGAIPSDGGFDAWAPENVAPMVTFLASDVAAQINGQVFVVHGGTVTRMIGWQEEGTITVDERWEVSELIERAQELMPGLVAAAPDFPVAVPGT